MNLISVFTRIISDNKPEKLTTLPYFCMDDFERSIFEKLQTHYTQYGELPTREALKRMELDIFYDTSIPLMKDSIEYVIDEYTEKLKRNFLGQIIEKERITAEEEHRPVNFDAIYTSVQQLMHFAPMALTNSVTIFDKNLAEMFAQEHASCLSLGLGKIDNDVTISPGTLNVIVARLKVGKTMMLCDLAIKMAKQGKKVLFFSREMTNREILKRMYSMLVGVNSRLFNTKNQEDLNNLIARSQKELEKIRQAGGNIILPLESLNTLDRVIAAVDFYDPDVLMGDSVYQMSTANGNAASDWRAFMDLIIGFKELSVGTNRSQENGGNGKPIVVFVTTQLKRADPSKKDDEITPADVAYSNAVGENADLMLGLRPTNGSDDERIVEIVANRHGIMGTWEQIHFSFDEGKIEVAVPKPIQTIRIGSKVTEGKND